MTDSQNAERDMLDPTTPASVEGIACDMSAIPAQQRATHIAVARDLFGSRQRVHEVEDGIEVVLPVERLRDAAAFIENERLCCRHLTFRLTVPERDATLALRVTGPGAAEELRALAR